MDIMNLHCLAQMSYKLQLIPINDRKRPSVQATTFQTLVTTVPKTKDTASQN